MRLIGGNVLYAASDLVHFMDCRHHTILDLMDLETPLPKTPDDESAELIQSKGLDHERTYLEHLKASGLNVVEVAGSGKLDERLEATRDAMTAGAEIVYQAVFHRHPWHGYADFLRRVDGTSRFGEYGYEAIDTKLSRTPRPKHIIQLCVYSDLLTSEQGTAPSNMHLVLGDGREASFRTSEYIHLFGNVRGRFEAFCHDHPTDTYPEPCAHCDLCCWRRLCEDRRETDDHLSLVANIGRSQIRRLNEADIVTVEALAAAPNGMKVSRIGRDTLARLQHQARLQVRARRTGERSYEILPPDAGRGFARLPRPDQGDLYFDIEGDPLYPDGLEYLLGIYGVDGGKPWFRPLWAHDHQAERASFEALIDQFAERFARFPDAHIYHYSHYEPTAIKRLAARYGTREAAVDDLLRQHRFVDLYKVVREAIRVSEASYSLKAIEGFYSPKREGEVTTAGDSIVVYERWRQTGEQPLLDEIGAYNEVDCASTHGLHQWLLTVRPAGTDWFAPGVEEGQPSDAILEAEAHRLETERRLLQDAPAEEQPLRTLVAHLLDFHRREAKPQWWAMFERQSAEDDELVEDGECLGGLTAAGPNETEKRSFVRTYRFPPQETKLEAGDTALVATTLDPAGTIATLNLDAGLVRLKRGTAKGPLPDRLSLIPGGPIKTDVIRDAIYRFAENVIAGDARYSAVRDLLRRERPRIRGHTPGAPLIGERADVVRGAVDVVSRMDSTCLFIQGPPGAGKTFTASHVILALMEAGHRVGVTSNSHKAIHNLLHAVEQRAKEAKVEFRGIKKASLRNEDTYFEGEFITSVCANDQVDPSVDLVAGTAWLFSDEILDQGVDFLFVDEAGQISLANIVAMGLSARNIVLIGDQMQLGQPIQGVHPEQSGLSVLDYLLGGKTTIPPSQGIFLPKTWRMQDDLCRFISDAVYDGRLQPEESCVNQRLVLGRDAHQSLAPAGLAFVPVKHQGCSQRCEAEGTTIKDVVESLLHQRYKDRHGRSHRITLEDVLVVAPYNMQVNFLKSLLPAGARVGTVDKFQGQEAAVVLVSMTTSSGEEMPRNIEFLFSRNRLNVAISRARCLAMVFANPRLLDTPCQSVEQMRLVNTLCWVAAYGGYGR